MSSTSAHLAGGQFYGQVAERQRAAGAVLSEVVHRVPRALPRHMHQRTYISLLLGGTYGEEIGRRPVHHGRLSVSVRPAGVEHRDWIGSNGGRFFMVELVPEWLAVAQGGEDRLAVPTSLHEPDALWAMVRLYREFRRWEPCSPSVVEGLTATLMACAEGASRVDPRHRPPWLLRVADMVRDRSRDNLRLSELAREAGVHPAHVARTFRRFYGRSPAELARELRLRRACEGLAAGERPLAELAFEAGFADQAHMTRLMVRYLTMTPGQVRRLVQGGRPPRLSGPAGAAPIAVPAPSFSRPRATVSPPPSAPTPDTVPRAPAHSRPSETPPAQSPGSAAPDSAG